MKDPRLARSLGTTGLLAAIAGALALVWTLIIAISLTWSGAAESRTVLDLAKQEARASLAKDLLYRHWLTSLGGVYARITPETPPNPYLTNATERDIITDAGQRLTLINPAYMNRQVYEHGRELGIGASHLTSLKPLRPGNLGDSWETNALMHIEKGEREFSSVENLNGRPHLRFMQAMVIDRSCLHCHTSEGYREGELHGGMTVTVDLAPFEVHSEVHNRQRLLEHAGLWLLGLCGLAGGYGFMRRRLRDRDQALARLQAAEAELTDFYEHAPDMFLLLDAGTANVLACNQTLLAKTGLQRQDIIGEPLARLCDPTCVPHIVKAWEEFLRSGTIHQLETRLLTTRSSTLEIELSATAIRDGTGRLSRGRVVMRDVTQRKAHEREIERLTRLYATLSQVNQAITSVATEDDLFQRVCRIAVEFGGFAGAWIGRLDPASQRVVPAASSGRAEQFAQGHHPNSNVPWEAGDLVADCLRTRSPRVSHNLVTDVRWAAWSEIAGTCGLQAGAALPICVNNDLWGTLVVYASEAEALRDKEVGLLAEMALDVSSGLDRLRQMELRAQADEALRSNEAKLRALVENIPQKIFVKDRASRYLFINQNLAKDLGTPPEQANGKTDYDFFSRELAEQYRADDRRVLETGQTEEREERYLENSRPVWIHTVKAPLRDTNGTVIGLCGIFRDITESRQAESTRQAFLSLGMELSAARRPTEAARAIFETADRLWKFDAAMLDICLPGDREMQPVLYLDVVDGVRREIPPSAAAVTPTPKSRRIMAHGAELLLRAAPYAEQSDSVFFGDTARASASLMSVPLRSQGGPLGVISIQSYSQDAFNEADLRTLQAMADQCSGAIERIRAEQALRESDERFRTLLQDVPSVAIQGYAADGTTQYWNQASERLYGFTAEEAIGRNLLDLIIPLELREPVGQAIRGMAATGIPIPPGEITLKRKDGSRVDVFSSHTLIHIPGRPVELFCVDVDLTERNQTAAALRRREQILAAVSLATKRLLQVAGWRQAIGDVLARLGEAAQVSRAVLFENQPGDNGEILMSQTTEWATGSLKLRTGDPSLRNIPVFAAGFARWAAHMNQGLPVQGHVGDFPPSEQTALRAHSILSIAVVPIMVKSTWWGFLAFDSCETERTWKTGEVEALQAAANILGEAIERQEIEEARHQSERLLQLVMDLVPHYIFARDRSSRNLFVNRAWAEACGLAAECMVGRDDVDLLADPAQAEEFAREDREVILTGKPTIHRETKFTDAKGRARTLRTTRIPFTVPSTGEPAIIGVAEDITEQRLLEDQVRNTQKMEAIGLLAGGVAHDFNNILAAFMMNLGMILQRPDLDEEMRESLRELEAGSHRAASLTRQLLLFGRRSVMQPQPLDLNETIVQILKMLRRIIGENIDLEWQGEADLPNVMADAGMLDQVVMNLAVNARDAMPNGGRLCISTRTFQLSDAQAADIPGSFPGHFVCLSVIDTGCGMDKATLKRIFEPFFTTKAPGRGTGLGLATVYGIVTQHQGWIRVQSEVNRGTTFEMMIPAIGESVTRSQDMQETAVSPEGNETILFAEDDDAVRRITSGVLRRLGYKVIEAHDGVEAMELWSAQQDEIKLLLTDMVMPKGITGLQLAERLRATHPGLRVIVCSGYSADLVQDSTLAAGTIAYIPKPYTLGALASKVRQTLNEP